MPVTSSSVRRRHRRRGHHAAIPDAPCRCAAWQILLKARRVRERARPARPSRSNPASPWVVAMNFGVEAPRDKRGIPRPTPSNSRSLTRRIKLEGLHELRSPAGVSLHQHATRPVLGDSRLCARSRRPAPSCRVRRSHRPVPLEIFGERGDATPRCPAVFSTDISMFTDVPVELRSRAANLSADASSRGLPVSMRWMRPAEFAGSEPSERISFLGARDG